MQTDFLARAWLVRMDDAMWCDEETGIAVRVSYTFWRHLPVVVFSGPGVVNAALLFKRSGGVRWRARTRPGKRGTAVHILAARIAEAYNATQEKSDGD